jgi:hypothetical protein
MPSPFVVAAGAGLIEARPGLLPSLMLCEVPAACIGAITDPLRKGPEPRPAATCGVAVAGAGGRAPPTAQHQPPSQGWTNNLSGWSEVLLVTGGEVPPREVASRVAEAFHSTADPTRPPAVCVPQRVRQPLLPRRLSLRPAEPAPRPAPHRLAPGHDPAVPPWPVGGGHRRAVGLRPWHGAPWVHRYNPHGTSGLGDRPRAGRPPLGSPACTSAS